VVIAIIAILASMVAVALPRALERAKIARMTGAMNNLRTALTQYYTQHNSYPPAYGYRMFHTLGMDPGSVSTFSASGAFWVSNLMGALQLYSATDLYDEFSEGYSTSQPPSPDIKLLEFSPIARTERGEPVDMTLVDDPVYSVLYDGTNMPDQERAQAQQTQRPFIYVPVNKQQFQRAKKYWEESGDWLATTWNPSNTRPGNLIYNMQFPPPSYDAYVLISVGPGVGTFGIIDEPPFLNSIPEPDRYHLLGLRAYFLATRDMNGNSVLDFHYENRVRGDEAELVAPDRPLTPLMRSYFQSLGVDSTRIDQIVPNSLPDPDRFNGYGPWIYVVE
jgi:type II secretory pathway pseudopilin PulG